jgi:hypothetical protein
VRLRNPTEAPVDATVSAPGQPQHALTVAGYGTADVVLRKSAD